MPARNHNSYGALESLFTELLLIARSIRTPQLEMQFAQIMMRWSLSLHGDINFTHRLCSSSREDSGGQVEPAKLPDVHRGTARPVCSCNELTGNAAEQIHALQCVLGQCTLTGAVDHASIHTSVRLSVCLSVCQVARVTIAYFASALAFTEVCGTDR